jgi:hypothetical protein
MSEHISSSVSLTIVMFICDDGSQLLERIVNPIILEIGSRLESQITQLKINIIRRMMLCLSSTQHLTRSLLYNYNFPTNSSTIRENRRKIYTKQKSVCLCFIDLSRE